MLDKARYIVVEGPIGAGKTSLAKRLAERLQAETLLEQAERNPFLGRFYQQPERWGMATQLSFLFQRIDQLAGLGPIEGERRVVADFLFDKDRLFAEQNLAESELALYQRVHDTLQPVNAPRPDLVMAGLVPAIHVFLAGVALRHRKTWMPATSAGMTSQNIIPAPAPRIP